MTERSKGLGAGGRGRGKEQGGRDDAVRVTGSLSPKEAGTATLLSAFGGREGGQNFAVGRRDERVERLLYIGRSAVDTQRRDNLAGQGNGEGVLGSGSAGAMALHLLYKRHLSMQFALIFSFLYLFVAPAHCRGVVTLVTTVNRANMHCSTPPTDFTHDRWRNQRYR